ncbi:LamG-like jellyroll fold domain-containing protein [Flavobacterium sp. LAR06]|uniref:Ig-like domain-containing protein n=1 Tax=Flavobacterium sp. LAR06 TaxID=3064897 RepID=UPI0035C00C0D
MDKKLLYFVRSLFLNFSNSSKERSFTPGLRLLCLGMFFVSFVGFAQTTNTWDGSSGDGLWSTASNWSTNSVPTSSQDVIIPNGSSSNLRTVNINSSATCKSLTINSGGNLNTISIVGSNSLVILGAVTIGAGTGNGDHKYIDVAGGTFSCSGITMTATGNANRKSGILISSGTVTVSNNITMNDSNDVITFAGSGTLNVGGTITGGMLTASSGTVNYNNAVSQTIGNYSYNNLTLSNSGTKTFPASVVAISGSLNINSGVVANLNTFTHTAGTLNLGGATTSAGSWGSTTSTADNRNDTFFAATTGLINVSSPSCTPPVIFAMTGTDNVAYCSTEAGTTIGLSGSQSGVNYQLYRGTVAVGSPVAGTGSAISFGAFNTTGKYTVKAIRTSLCTAIMSGGPITVYKYSSPPTITGTVTHVGCPTSATGKIDITNASNPASLGFVRASTDATTQGVNLGQTILSNRAAFTVEGWIKFDNLNYVTRMSIFGQNDAIEVAFEDDNLRCYTAGGGTVDIPKSEISAGLWYHIAATGDGSNLRLYLNGVLRKTTTASTTNYGSSSYTAKIGYAVMDAAGNGLTGEIFKVGFWSTALSDADVAKLATGFVDYDASFSNLIAGYSFNDGPSANSLTGVGSSAPVGTFVNLTSATAWKDPYVYSWVSVPAGYTSTGKNLTGLLPGTYNVTTSLRNCTSFASFVVNATNTVPSITTQPSSTSTCVANNASFTIVGAGTGVNYQWQVSTNGGGLFTPLSNGGVYSTVTTATMNITGATAGMNNYQYRCIVGGTCTPAVTSNAVVLTVNTPSAAPTSIGGITTLCNGGSTTLTAVGGTLGTGATYQWGTGATVGTNPISGATSITYVTGALNSNTTYWVRIENTTSPCTANTGGVSQAVTVNTPSVAPTSISGTTTICNGSSTTLTAVGGTLGTGANYQWGTGSVVGTSSLSGQTGSTLTITPGSSTTYWVRIENTTSPCAATTGGVSQLVTVNQKSADPVSASAGSPTICNGVSTTLTLNGGGGGTGATIKWYTGSCGGTSVGTGNGLSVSPSVTTTYYGRYEDGTPCNNSACSSVTITVNTVTVAPTITIKQPTCTVLTGVITVTSPAAGTGYNYSIDGSDYTNTTGIFTVAENTTYNVTTKNSSGCISPAEPAIILPSSDRVWNGSIDTDWTKAGNWTPNVVPGNTDCVVIPTTGTQPEIAAGTSADAYSLTIGSQGLLTVNSKAILTVVTGITVASDGNLVFEDDSSLLQKTENAVNTGNITYKRITAKVSRYDFTFWSSPVTRTPLAYTLADVSPLTLADKFYSYIPAVGWKVSYRGELPMEPGMGYIIRAPQTYAVAKALAQTYEASFIGKPNNGTIEITPVKDESIMVGNPYPSALNAREFIEYNELVRNVQVGSLYFWTHNSPPSTSTPGDYKYNYTTSDYAVYNLTGSTTGASTLPNNDPPSGFIAAGAAFFMTPNSSDKIAFTNDMRVGTDNDQFFKTAKAKDEGKNRLWLNLINNQGAFKQLLVGYLDGATNNFDYNYDGETLDGNTYVDFYSINETDKLTIQGRALPFSDADLIPLGYVSSIVGDFTISIDHADGLFDTQAVYLEDKNTGKTVDLRAANYTFTTAKGTFEDRFVLKYADKTLGTGDFENIENGLLVSVKDKVVKITSAKESIKEVTIFDINGKLLYDKKKVGSTELQISNLQAANQVLLVKVMLENGFTTTKKIIFQ